MELTDYDIIGFDETVGQIQVHFKILNYPILVDLHPDETGHYPEGEVLDAFIRGLCPTGHYIRSQAIAAGIPNASKIAALVVPSTLPKPQTVEAPTIQQKEVEDLINMIKSSNPTT